MAQWKLINEKTGEEIQVGDTLTTFRGERVTLIGVQPPHKPEATGKVVCEDRNHRDSVWYANVVGCRFERAKQPEVIDGHWKIEED
jgi:hypothetical protein